MGKNNKVASISAIVLLYTLSFSNNANAGFFDWLGSREDSSNLLNESSRNNNPSFEDGLKAAFEKNDKEEPKIKYDVIHETLRQVTAYNVGDRAQTDSTPCTGAYSKVDLCEEVAKGVRVCAANFVPLGTILRIVRDGDQSFECIVWDRMNSRYTSRVDIAMSLSEKSQARQFGLRKLNVQILEKVENKEISI